MGTSLSAIDAFLSPSSPSPFSAIDAFLAQPSAPAASNLGTVTDSRGPAATTTPSPLADLFTPQPSPSPLSSPPVGPDVVDLPGQEPEPGLTIAQRVQRVLRGVPDVLSLDGAGPATPPTAPPVQPLQGTEALGAAYRGIQGAISLPAQAIEAGTTRAFGRPASEMVGEAIGGLVGVPAAREGVAAAERVAAAHPTVPGLGIAARAGGVGVAMVDEAAKVAGKLGTDPAMWLLPASKALQTFFVPGMIESAGEEFAQARALYEAAGNEVTPEVARAVVRAVSSTAFATAGGLHMARNAAGGPVTRESVAAAVERLKGTPERPAVAAPQPAPAPGPAPATAPTGGTRPAPPTEPPVSGPTPVTEPPATAPHPDADLLTQAITALRGARAEKASLIRDGMGRVIGRIGNQPHPGKVEFGLQGMKDAPKDIARGLERLLEGKPSKVGERALEAMKEYDAEQLATRERVRVRENIDAGRTSFDPEALDLPAIEGARHGEGTEYRDTVMSAANTHLTDVSGRGVVSRDVPTGQRWYGMKAEDGTVRAAMSITPEGLITDWAGEGAGTGLVLRRAIKDNPDLTFDLDSLTPDSARVLNRVMNSGTKIGEAVRVQWEAHLREQGLHPEQAGGTVPSGGTDGPNPSSGPGGGGGRGGGAGGKPPAPVVEQGGSGPPREGQSGGGSGAPPRPPTAEGVAPEPVDPVKKLLNLIRQAPKAIRETEGLRMSERVRRAQELDRITSTLHGKEALIASRGALKGKLPQADFEPVGPKLTEAEATALLDRALRAPDLQTYERHNAAEALTNILEGGRIPQRGEIALLERVFGNQMTDAILSRRHWTRKMGENIIDSLGLARSIRTAYDMSAPLRQGLVLTVGYPKIAARNTGRMFRLAFSPKEFSATQAEIRSRPNAKLYEDTGLFLATTSRAAGVRGREESFASRYAEKIPGVALSERGYVGYLNLMRADAFDYNVSVWKRGGVTPETSPSRYKGLAAYINWASGRGDLGGLASIAPLLNGVFFSPRFMMSRLQAINPMTYSRMDPAVRKVAARDMAATLGAGIAIISLAKLGGAKVETDPRSSDFGKIRVGPTRIDVWGGLQQPMRYLAQIATGQRKPENGGIQPQRDRASMAGRFVRSKLAPVPSAGMDLAIGKDFIGNDVTLVGEAKELFPPMFLQDFLEASQEHGFVTGAALSAPSFFGAGVTTHQPRGDSRGR